MAEAAQVATGGPAQPINVVADAGYSNGEQAEACEAKGILPHVPANRGVNSRGDGTLFDARNLLINLRATRSCARLGIRWPANKSCGKTVPCSMQHNRKSAEPAR